MVNQIQKVSLFIFLGCFFLLTSCGEKPFFDQSYNFPADKWSVEDTARFEVLVEDTLSKFDFILTLRTRNTYKYSNLWVHILSTAPDNTTSKVAQRINLARPDGSWIGRTSGTLVESKLHYRTTSFPKSGTYVFQLVQAIQQDEVADVVDISLRIEPAK